MDLLTQILAALWFFLPVGIANATPVIAMNIPILKDLNYPLDFYKSWRGIRIFGDHKTFRGLISGMIFGFLVVALQAWMYGMGDLGKYMPTNSGCAITDNQLWGCIDFSISPVANIFVVTRQISWVNFEQVNWVAFGLLAGAGPLLGDAIKSFFKRRMNLKPGATWFPFDQIDYILGGIFFTLPIIQLDWWKYLLVAVVWFLLHPMATVLGYLLKLKDSPI